MPSGSLHWVSKGDGSPCTTWDRPGPPRTGKSCPPGPRTAMRGEVGEDQRTRTRTRSSMAEHRPLRAEGCAFKSRWVLEAPSPAPAGGGARDARQRAQGRPVQPVHPGPRDGGSADPSKSRGSGTRTVPGPPAEGFIGGRSHGAGSAAGARCASSGQRAEGTRGHSWPTYERGGQTSPVRDPGSLPGVGGARPLREGAPSGEWTTAQR
jgi:hypothetical protein